jgi:uncharacterized membrane protein YjjP (DUF1212 family)
VTCVGISMSSSAFLRPQNTGGTRMWLIKIMLGIICTWLAFYLKRHPIPLIPFPY